MPSPEQKPVEHCTSVYPGGRTLEIRAPHLEWVAYGVRAVENHEKLVTALRNLIVIAEDAMTEANLRGCSYLVDEELSQSRQFLAVAEVPT